MNQIDYWELNEAFSVVGIENSKRMQLDPSKVNVNGGAIALGHPLGCTGAKLSVQIINELRRRNQKYGIVTMCVGTGQGAAGVIELLK
jgi:acetyl-CoA acyltransferase